MLFEEPKPRRGAGLGAYIPLIAGTLLLGAMAAVLVFGALMVGRATSADPSPDGEAAYEDGFPIVDWDYWLSINPDIVAWVTVPGTDVDYPVIQADASAPDYWNEHDVYGDWSIFGCPFLHADNAATGGILESQNAVFQGHNIQDLNSQMFSAFANFADEAYASEHPEVLVQTPDGVKLRLQPFAVEVVPNAGYAAVLSTEFDSDAQFRQYVAERVEASQVVFEDRVPDDRMWTFSTCSYFLTPANERTVVHCSLKSISRPISAEGGE